jgi:hypothetical protein
MAPYGHGAVTQVLSKSFPSDKVYRRDDRRIVGVESLGPQGLAFVVHPHECWT